MEHTFPRRPRAPVTAPLAGPATADALGVPPALVAECRATMARHARSFDRAARFLPGATRDRVAVLYTFCRVVDDAVDEAPDPASAQAAIDRLHAELRAASRPADPPRLAPRPLVTALVRSLDGQPAALEAAHALCAGVASDVRPARVADDAELIRYCYAVAGTVGVLMCAPLGVTDPAALPFAIDFGIAMQLTNICRDVLEDAHRGRVYLPATRLAAAGTSQDALLTGRANRQAITRVVLDLLDLADRYYASTDIGLGHIPFVGRQAILVARHLYAAIGHKLRRAGGDALAGRTVVGSGAKAALIVRALARNLHPHTHGLHGPAGIPAHDPTLHEAIRDLPGADRGRAGADIVRIG